MKNIRIDFVSDVACPWCAIGLGSLEQAIDQLKDEINIEIQFHPFELNPGMPPGGQDTMEHLMQKYGSSHEQIAANQAQIQERAKAAGFPFNEKVRPRVYNTFTCHRLLHWAQTDISLAAQYLLKRELLKAYFTNIENLDEKWIKIKFEKIQGELIISVTDSGRGIPEEIVEKLMTPFFTTKELGKGTGIGLSLCKKIINQHGGTFFYNNQTKNTQFILNLPQMA
jgi:hypothetical protein